MSDMAFEWIETSDPRMAEVSELRYVTLFEPFGVPRCETWNDDIPGIHHLIVTVDGRVSGYACLIVAGESGQVRQVCVLPALRGAGLGRGLMTEVVAHAQRLGLSLAWLNARTTVEDFYRRLGWVTTSGEFPFGRTGVPHVRMEHPLHTQPAKSGA
ncbi:MAG: GNAT family N-acetyltransferase [Coriobacteriia bacterium]|nr:GNAT family N-acetyltransferase [Coriobacteriia bacterium]